MCIDYRKLNEITVKDAYPLPRLGQTIDALQSAGFFSSLDLASGYWQVPVAREDRHKTAFCTPDGGLFEFVKMPSGLTNAPATFQRLMNNIFAPDLFQHVLIFLDDVLTYSKTPEEHLHHLEKVFLTLRRAGLKLKPKKCNLFQTEVHYLGHVIDKGGIRPNPQKLDAVRNWERPKTVTQVRSFTAFCNYYRKFVKNFAEVAKPLYALTSKAVKFTWNEEHEEAFQLLKMRLLQAPILSFPNFSYPFVIDTDASETALGAVLSQVIGGEERPVAFESRVLTKTEVNYATTKREALGIVQAMQWFRPYIYGTQCIVGTDHASLQWLFRQNADGLTFRMIQKMQEYDYRIVHRPGEKHNNADGLSRRPNEKPEWKLGEEEELRGVIPQFETFDSALEGAEKDIKRKTDQIAKHDEVVRHAKLQVPHPPREVVRYETGIFIAASESLIFCNSGDMRVKTEAMTQFVAMYSHLRPGLESVNRVGGVLIYWDPERERYIYLLLVKEKYTDVAEYDRLKECLERVREHANVNGVSHFAMPRIGCVDDRLEWINVAICIDSIFQDRHCTVTVYTPKDEMERYPEVKMTQRNGGSAADFCATATPEEMRAAESVTERISWTKSDSALAEQQKLDQGIRCILNNLNSEVVKLKGTIESLGENSISKDDAMTWGNPEAVELWTKWEELAMSNGVLFRRWKPSNRVNEVWQAVVPKSRRQEVLYQLHDAPTSGGHFAVEKTLARIRQRFWWPFMRSNVERHIANCDRCAARSTAGKNRRAELQSTQVFNSFKVIAADILGPVTLASKTKAKYILVISDLYTKYVVTVPLQDMTAATVANAIVEEWIMRYGAPDVLHTDQGTNFNSDLMHDICRLFMIDKTRTTPYHPQGNGQVERFNRVIADTISKYCAEKPHLWDTYLPYVTFVYNTTVHRTIGTTPYSMLFGKEAQYPIDLFYPKPPGDPRLVLGEDGLELNEKLYEVHSHAQATMGKEQRRQRDYFNRKVHGDPFKAGDLVWLFEPHRAKSRKFYLPWQGPYEVLNKTSEVTYKICKSGRPERWTKVHFNRLKPYIGEPEIRRSKRNATRPMPLYEEIPSVSDESDKEMEDRPFHVFSGTSAETRANCNRPRVTFEKLPIVIEESQSETDDREISHPYEEIPPRQPSPLIATYERIDKNDSDDEIPDDNRPRVPPEKARERPKTLVIHDVAESNSDVSSGRSRRLPIRFGKDEYVTKSK